MVVGNSQWSLERRGGIYIRQEMKDLSLLLATIY